jgi:hypothetical protein
MKRCNTVCWRSASYDGRRDGENSENHTFCDGMAALADITVLCFRYLAEEIRYLAEQWNFATDQRI